MKKPTKKQIKEAYRIVQSERGKRSAKVGMPMSERGKLGAEAKKAKREQAKLDTLV